ncbi:MAG: type VI secretion system protein TssA [Gammaproteobacteria bacterium]|nr:type VI secretion system protein TssA [Gammaproteobacteria bacterium]MBU1489819.1 type VI secretion system protein TssA [Gammaproteobacteria bacterium]MBU2067738.1 type VI secretion system protein TssA [Gammaproteobacteria bacterium]MBU2140921.1 type VI secretion system protein TssA [Gammaproteobacteria bacterium]MBU2218407.1 type VI secretion system protein TssA [Gammaproteobacteria bacterium]
MSQYQTTRAITDYLTEIPGEQPCGPSLRYEPVWDRLRELRREDDSSLPTGVWQADPKRGDWVALEQLAGELLRERSKDLMLAAWLGEAWLRLDGLHGIGSALALFTELCERYPDDLHPQPEDGDRSWRVSPLEWVSRRYSEMLLTHTPLFASEPAELCSLTLHAWRQLQQRQVPASDSKADKAVTEAARTELRRLNEAIRHLPISHFIERCELLDFSLMMLDRLITWSDDWLGELAPSLGLLRQTLETIRALMQEHIPMQAQTPAPAAPQDGPGDEETDAERSVPVIVGGTPSSREDAYRQLALIADYLVRTEPHSPVPYVIRRAVEWGNQPLSDLLDELISPDAESRRLWKLLGVLK